LYREQAGLICLITPSESTVKVSRPSRPFPGHWHLHASHSQPGDKEDDGVSEYKMQHELKVTLSVSDTIMTAGKIERVTNARIRDRVYCGEGGLIGLPSPNYGFLQIFD
jgi:hypothetical protein